MSIPSLGECTFENKASVYASSILKSKVALISNPSLHDDYEKLLLGHCIYIPNMFCGKTDYSILQEILKDLENHKNIGMQTWSKHFKHENPDISPTFVQVLVQMAEYFDVDIYASRLNYYGDENAWKPFHQDSHSTVGEGKREDFTMGVSFGESRLLTFLHPNSGQTFNFPQNNGDVFAFTSVANKKFQHGVPKPKGMCGPRISLIAWGCRRTLNSKNCGKEELISQRGQSYEGEKPSYFVSAIQVREADQEDEEKPDVPVADAIQLFKNWISQQKSLATIPIPSSAQKSSPNTNSKTSNIHTSSKSNSTSLSNSGDKMASTNSSTISSKAPVKKSRVQGGWSK
jgi:hypothetical protein